MSWQYNQPVNLVFGNGKLKELHQYVAGKNGILITSPSFLKNQTVASILSLLADKVKYVFSDVSPNPDIRECEACVDLVAGKDIDFILALGGGSVIDVAKMVSVMLVNQAEVGMWIANKESIPNNHIDVIAIPTTAGTGSEVTCVAVVSDHSANKKIPLRSKSFYPKLAIIDPELTFTVPSYVTACTGFDVLCHAIEAYCSKHHQPVCDALAIHAIRLTLDNLEIAYQNPYDKDAREHMAEASLIAGLSFAIPQTTASHACSYPLTTILHIPHGEACALTIDYFMKFNSEHGCKRVQTLATLVGFQTVDDMVDHLSTLRHNLGLKNNLKSFSIRTDMLKEIVDDACQNNALHNNPIVVKRENLMNLFTQLL